MTRTASIPFQAPVRSAAMRPMGMSVTGLPMCCRTTAIATATGTTIARGTAPGIRQPHR